MKYEIVREFPHQLLYESGELSISIYQPTHRHGPENEQDSILFKNNIQEIRKNLLENFNPVEVDEILDPLYQIESERPFWNHAEDGIGVFLNKNACIVYRLPRKVKNYISISDSFHIKPLLRIFQSADNYHVLCINRKDIKLFEGNRYGLEEIEFGEGVETSLEELLGSRTTDKYIGHRTFSANSPAGGAPMFHGHGSKKDEIFKDIDRYFRYIDKFIAKEYSFMEDKPLVLVGLTEYQSVFRRISINSNLVEEGINKDYETISKDELEKEAWNIMENFYLGRTEELKNLFHNAGNLSSGDPAQVVRAATEGRVGVLILESDKIIHGKVDRETGNIIENDNEDLLNDLAKVVFEHKGEVVMLPKERMMTDTGVAGIYRY